MKNIITISTLVLAITYLSSCGEGVLTKVTSESSNEPPEVSFTAEPADLSARDIYVYDEAPVSWTTNADKVECSRDGGTNFADCTDEGSFQWEYADFNQVHIIKASLTGAQEDYEYSFTPSSLFSGNSFVECDVSVSADEEFDAFEARLTVANQVICIEDGVSISNSDAIADDEIDFAASGITVIARSGTTATFITDRVAGTEDEDSIFDTNAETDTKLVGLRIERNNPGGRSIHISPSSTNTSILNNTIVQDGGGISGRALIYDDGGISGQPTLIKGNTIIADNSIAIEVDGTVTSIVENTITGKATVLDSYNPSVLTSEGNSYTFLPDSHKGSEQTITVAVGGTLSLTNDEVYDGNGDYVFRIFSNLGDTSITLASTRVTRLDANAGNENKVFYIGGSADNGIYAGDSNNIICKVSSSPGYTGLIDGTNTGDFSAADYGGSITICP